MPGFIVTLLAFLGTFFSVSVVIPLCSLCLGVVVFVFWAHALVLVLTEEKGDDRLIWLLVVIFTSIFGAVLYRLVRTSPSDDRPFDLVYKIALVGTLIVAGVFCCLLFTTTMGMLTLPSGGRPTAPYSVPPVVASPTFPPNILTLAAELPTPTPTATPLVP